MLAYPHSCPVSLAGTPVAAALWVSRRLPVLPQKTPTLHVTLLHPWGPLGDCLASASVNKFSSICAPLQVLLLPHGASFQEPAQTTVNWHFKNRMKEMNVEVLGCRGCHPMFPKCPFSVCMCHQLWAQCLCRESGSPQSGTDTRLSLAGSGHCLFCLETGWNEGTGQRPTRPEITPPHTHTHTQVL